MALVNAAVTLALRGRRVLAVDFDVEAPGLDTFDVLRPREEIPGVIDFVASYLDSGQAPDATNFIGECPDVGEHGGRLWIMPSGRNETYAANFNQSTGESSTKSMTGICYSKISRSNGNRSYNRTMS